MQVRNATRETLGAVPVKGEVKDGQPATDSIEAGEIKNLDVDPENPTVKAYLLMGVLVEERAASRRAPNKE